jgi:hypothetical protein
MRVLFDILSKLTHNSYVVVGLLLTMEVLITDAPVRTGRYRRCQNHLACRVMSLAVVREEKSTGHGTEGKAE